jgi:hypothetical protein
MYTLARWHERALICQEDMQGYEVEEGGGLKKLGCEYIWFRSY